MRSEAKDLMQKAAQEVSQPIVEIGTKTSIGITGTIAAMTIHDFAGLIVAFLTAIYMVLQIESAWQKRKKRIAKKKDKEAKNGKSVRD